MTGNLLLVTLGPVQDFIAQARRTRDLWYGSHLLSELGRAAARALVDGGAMLIFPSLDAGAPELAACLAPLRTDNTPPQNIANKLLAEVPEGTDPQQLAKAARKAVSDYWRNEVAAPVRTKCAGLLAQNIDAVWNEQTDSFLEFSASWLPLGDYAETRRQLEQAIAGRKLLPDSLLMEVDGEVTTSVLGDVAWARHRATLFAEKLQPPLSTKVRVADAVQKVFAGREAAQKVQVNEAFDEFSAYVDHGRTLPKSRTFKKLQGDPVPGSTHELYAWSDGATGRLFGHYDATGVFAFDRLAGHLP
jgi:hypothetical protein